MNLEKHKTTRIRTRKHTKMLYLGADHRGYNLKEEIKKYLTRARHKFDDLGAFSFDSDDDYPDFAYAVAKKVAKNPIKNRGILICGSGIGMCMAANKVKRIRSGLVLSYWMAKMSRFHDNTNILSLASDITDSKTVKRIVKIWLETKFSGEERYKRRIKKIQEIERSISRNRI